MVARRQLIYHLVIVVAVVPPAKLAYLTWLVSANGLLTMNGHMLVVRDYLWLWGAGQLLKVGDVHTIFNPHAFAAWLRGPFGAYDFAWSYPPSLLFLALPAGHASILSGFCPVCHRTNGVALVHRKIGRANAWHTGDRSR